MTAVHSTPETLEQISRAAEGFWSQWMALALPGAFVVMLQSEGSERILCLFSLPYSKPRAQWADIHSQKFISQMVLQMQSNGHAPASCTSGNATGSHVWFYVAGRSLVVGGLQCWSAASSGNLSEDPMKLLLITEEMFFHIVGSMLPNLVADTYQLSIKDSIYNWVRPRVRGYLPCY